MSDLETARTGTECRRLSALIAVAAFLRLLWLGSRSFWLDEGAAYMIATAKGRPHDSYWAYQAFYYELLHYWIRLGDSEFMIRLLSVLPSVATIPVVYLLGKRLFSRRVATISALLITFHAAHITYSQQARSYGWTILFCCLSTLFFARSLSSDPAHRRGAADWMLYILFSALAVYSHLLACLVMPAQYLSVAALPRRSIQWRWLAICAIALVVILLPPILLLRGGTGGTAFISAASYRQLPKLITLLAGDPVTTPIYILGWVMAVRKPSPVANNQSSVASRQGPVASGHNWPLALVFSWAVTPIILLLLISLVKPAFISRYLLMCAPAAVLLAAFGLAAVPGKPRQWLLAATAVLSVGSLIFYHTRPKENWRGAAGYVYAHVQPGDAVLVLPPYSRAPFTYYRHRLGGEAVAYEVPDAPQPQPAWLEQLAAYRRLWLVAYTRDPSDAITQSYEAAVAGDFRLAKEQTFQLVNIRLYEALK